MRLVVPAVLLSLSLTAAAATPPPPLGFTPEHAAAQASLEARFASLLDPSHARAWMKQLSSRPHHVGSAGGAANAEFIAAQFRSWGYDTVIETFDVLFPTPRTRLLELVAPEPFRAALTEPPVAGDATSAITQDLLPPYNAYSGEGDVTADLVYVNFGTPADYEVLRAQGVDVKGRIVIARYGGSWRGIKPKVAAEHGAVGCIIYSDPRDDGYSQGDVYPAGPWRRAEGAQRGSVMDLPVAPGDPLTPGVGAVKGAKRLELAAATTIMPIPVLPISYADALPFLRALGGRVAPEAWRGTLPITYHLGPGPSRVHLKLEFDWNTVTARDVIARLRGTERPDEWIIRGNHHDAWVFGADDPVSGLVAMMEEARAVGELARQGWRPKRTLIYAAWDGEEAGLLGSTEWVETHAAELSRNAAVYLNSDSNGRGFFYAEGSHSLEPFINEVARAVTDPEKKISVQQRARAKELVDAKEADRDALRKRADLRIGAAGSGSDFTPFLQHLGIASLNVGFGGEDGGGSYHSTYDSFDHYTRFSDTDFAYSRALSELGGRAMLRLADADVLPFAPAVMAETIAGYVSELKALTESMRSATEARQLLADEGSLDAADDPRLPTAAPERQAPVPFLEFAPLDNAVAGLEKEAEALRPLAARAGTDAALAGRIDRLLIAADRALLTEGGLPRRPWYRHQIYAPGLYTGYSVKTLPAIREAIEERQWGEADEQIAAIARVVQQYREALAAVNGAK